MICWCHFLPWIHRSVAYHALGRKFWSTTHPYIFYLLHMHHMKVERLTKEVTNYFLWTEARCILMCPLFCGHNAKARGLHRRPVLERWKIIYVVLNKMLLFIAWTVILDKQAESLYGHFIILFTSIAIVGYLLTTMFLVRMADIPL